MKMNILTFLMAAGFVLGTFALPAEATEAKIAFVHVPKIFDAYEKTSSKDRVLQDAGKKRDEERDAMVYDIRQLKDELLLLTGDMKDKKQSLLEEKIKGLQDFDRNTTMELKEKQNEVIRDIFKDIDEAIARYGEKKGYDYIFNEKALLYHAEKYDVSDDILAELNQGYKKKK